MQQQLMKGALTSLLLFGALSASIQAQGIVDGTEIGVDFGPNNTIATGPSAASNFNSVSIASGTLIDVIDTTGTTLTGVDFTWSGSFGAGNATNNTFINDEADETQSSLPSVFDTTHTTDWLGVASNPTRPDPNFIVLTFSGLNDALAYDLIIGGAGGAGDIADTTWVVDGQSADTDADAAGASYVSFTGLSPDDFGNLVITGTGVGSREDVAAVSALKLRATIPEPSSFALLAGLLGLTQVMLRRRNS